MKKVLALFEGRHEMPDNIEGAVFHNITDPNNFEILMQQCDDSLKNCTELELYVTGLSTALVTVLSYCNYNMIPVTLKHHDKKSNSYYTQKVFTWDASNIGEYVDKIKELGKLDELKQKINCP